MAASTTASRAIGNGTITFQQQLASSLGAQHQPALRCNDDLADQIVRRSAGAAHQPGLAPGQFGDRDVYGCVVDVECNDQGIVTAAGFVGIATVFQLQRSGGGLVQPWIAAPQADQVLMQIQCGPAVVIENRWGEPNSGRTASSPPARSSLTPR